MLVEISDIQSMKQHKNQNVFFLFSQVTNIKLNYSCSFEMLEGDR
jgi:hypothetical protein